MLRHTIPIGSSQQGRLPGRYLAVLLLSFGLLAAGILLQNEGASAARRSRPAPAENGAQETTSAGKIELSPQTPSCVVPPSGLVGWWPGDTTTTDIQGSNNATLRGGVTFAAGEVLQAFSLNGTDGYVNVPSVAALNFGASDFTADLWVNFRDTTGEQELIEKYVQGDLQTNATTAGWSLSKLPNNTLTLSLGSGSGFVTATSTVLSIATNAWNHYAVRRSGSNFTVFMNGTAVLSLVSTFNLDSASSLKFGHRGSPGDTPGSQDNRGFFLSGLIDEVELFHRSLADAEIQALVNAGSAGKCKSPSLIQFNAANFSVNEGCTAATVTVTRSGDTSSQATVDVASSDRSAQQRTDYAIASATLIFDAGQTSKTFPVIVNKDAYAEGNETLNLSFNNPTGAILAAQNNATVTIIDDASVPTNSQPLDDTANFVCQHYHDFLSREPDSGGAAFWTGVIEHCGADPVCIRNKRVDVSNAFFYELEFQQTGAYVYRLYRVAYGNTQPFPNPDSSNATEANKLPAYLVFARDRARVVGGANLIQGQQDLANLFVQRPEFLVKYPANLDGSSFIDAVLNSIKDDLVVDLTAQKPGLLTLFSSGGRGAVLYRLADDNVQTNPINNRPLIDAEYNRAFVTTQYFGYLRRDSDLGGFLFWLGQVNGAPLRDVVRQHAMVCSFITSIEFQQRFSSVVSHTNAECSP